MTFQVCSGTFYNKSEVWHSWRPNLSACLLYTLQIFPCGVLWAIAPLQLYVCWKAPCKSFICTRIFVARIVFVALGICAVLFDVINAASNLIRDFIIYASSFILILSMALSGAIFYVERISHFCSSPANLVFYILLMLVLSFDLVVDITGLFVEGARTDLLHIISFGATLFTSSIVFILTCFQDVDHFAVETQEYACGMERASALSRLTFSWLSAFMYSPDRGQLNMGKTGANSLLRPADRCADNYENFRFYWEQMQTSVSGGASLRRLTFANKGRASAYTKPNTSSGEGSRPPLLRILLRVVGHYLCLSWFLKFFLVLLEFADPWVLYEIINFISDSSIHDWNGAFYAILYLILRIIATGLEHQAMYYSLIAGMRSRSMLIAAIYRKILRMNNDARSQASEGDIANLISVEVQKVCELQESMWVIISTALTAIICIPVLWRVMGKSVLSGISFLFLLVPFCGYLIFFLQNIEERETMHRDKRLSLLNEVFNGIGFLKLHSWESPYEIKIARLRLKELKSTRKVNLLNSSIEMLWTAAPFLVMLATFNAFLTHANETLGVLSAQKIFVTYSLIGILRTPISQVPWAISNIIDARVSFKRLGDFLMANDLDLYAKQTFPKSSDKAAVVMEYASFSWFTQGPVILSEIDLKINPGRIVAVFGRIGSGKSSLLSAILGEMRKVSGYVCTRGNFAYVPQDGWVQQMTIADNVVFGSEMDPEWYDQVLEACSLMPDLKTLDVGDATLIGEGGATLTAGQKQRITLARAVYQNADIYLLDEPLSAIDILVATEVFQQVIGRNGLLRKGTRIIATSQLQFLPLVDFIIVMKDGEIVERGPYYDLISRPTSIFSQYVKEQKRLQRFESVDEESSDVTPSPSSSNSEEIGPAFRMSRRSTVMCRARTVSFVSEFNIIRMESGNTATPFVSETTIASVLKSIYSARGLLFSGFVFFLCVATTTFNIISNAFLSYWSDDEKLHNLTIIMDPKHKQEMKELNYNYLTFYGAFGLLEIVFAFAYNIADAYASTRASELFHSGMLQKLMHAPMCVFYVTPIGRIMNRFSGDIDIVDHELPNNINELTEYFFNIIGCICIISISMPHFLVVVVVLMFIYFRIEVFYACVARQTRRLDFVTRSNLFTLFTETVLGAPVIRAFNAMDRMSDICDELTDDNARYFFTKIVCDRWLGVRLDIMASVFVFVAMGLAVFSRDSLQPGTVGLCISYAQQITDFLDCFMWQFSEVTAGSVAVERVMEFSDIEQERPNDDPLCKDPGPDWPSRGQISFKAAYGRERHGLNPVLRGVNAEINAGEHIGVVGRTGTGKSALTRAMFGLMELDSGSIEIDNVNIKTLPLNLLRSRLTILPQDPILFSGTLRHNLDPLNEYKDDDLWKVLRLVALEFRVQAHPRKLKLEIAERGTNLSIGERRLICIARTLLRKSKVLLLDEATAHLDSETSSLVIQIFRELFQSSTVIIITHSLASVMHTDRTIVLDRGRVREFDSPSNLIKNPYGFFYAMAKNAGFVSVKRN